MRTITIASPTEVFSRVIENGVNGFLSPASEWVTTLDLVRQLRAGDQEEIVKRAAQVASTEYEGAAQLSTIESTLSKVEA